MARGDDDVERGAGRTLSLGIAFVAVLLGLGAWGAVPGWGWYQLDPGEAAVILRLGEHDRTVLEEGIRFKLPPPIESLDIVNVVKRERVEFGDVDSSEPAMLSETAMQTSDNNIVLVEFVVQYRIGNPFEWKYRAHQVAGILADASQAAMREVVAKNTIDGVLSERRGAVESESADLLQELLAEYDTGLRVESIELQEVQPPSAVREAFDDVISANQDRNRKVNEAEGYANEVLPKARAEAQEVVAAAVAYRDATIAEADGESQRFLAIVAEYRKAPEITRKRMYLETMEDVLPDVEKILIEPGTASVLPYLPLGSNARQGVQ